MEEKRRLELIQWMDTQIEIRKQMQEERYCGETVMVCCPEMSDGIHIYAGIGELARAAKAEITFFKRSDVDYPFEYCFTYKNMRFFQLEESGYSFKNLLEG